MCFSVVHVPLHIIELLQIVLFPIQSLSCIRQVEYAIQVILGKWVPLLAWMHPVSGLLGDGSYSRKTPVSHWRHGPESLPWH